MSKKAKSEGKKERKEGKVSGLDAAAKVLTEAGTALTTVEILERIQTAGLWKTGGKTPGATLNAAIHREIKVKGSESRFKKFERGKFCLA